jgi:hypothetical protein
MRTGQGIWIRGEVERDLIGSGCITWQSKKQATVALSTAEAEYMSLSAAVQEMKWLRTLLEELGFSQEVTEMNQDNKSCIQITKGNASHQRSKHIDTRHHFVRDEIIGERLKMKWCPTSEMIADVLTKPLPRPRFLELRGLLNVIGLADFKSKCLKEGGKMGLHVSLLMKISWTVRRRFAFRRLLNWECESM